MRSPSDPIRSWRHALRGTWAAGVAAVALGIAWAASPGPQGAVAFDLPVPDPDGSAAAAALLRPAVDPGVFEVLLWHADPSDTPAEEHRMQEWPAEVRVDLVLVAVIGDGAGRRAALYDPATDHVTLIARGDGVTGGLSVAEIGADFVELVGPGRSARLTLGTEGEP